MPNNMVEETERALAAAKDREADLSHVIEDSRAEINMVENQLQIASACILSLEDER